jgi:phosphohistidine swiveling domain-containing protein/succinate dehydrogenase/fumarate reductase cytochrome b subunit
MLGATQGHEVEVAASGPQATEALAAIHALAERDFDDRPEANVAGTSAPAPSLAEPDVSGIVRGHPASPGIAIGPARRFRTPDLPIPEGPGTGADAERATFDTALADVRDEIVHQREHVAGMATADEAEIFDAHLLFLKDDALLAPTNDAIADGGRSAARAWHDVIERTAARWDALEDEYLRARAADLRSVGRQVLARLLGLPLPGPELEAPGVVIARDLAPADTVGLDPSMALGIVTAAGGPTSHAAVLARSLGIPAVVGAGDSVLTVPDETSVALDGSTGVVYVDPEASVVSELTAAREARGPVLRKSPGPTAWFDVRKGGTGHWAFSLNRFTALGLTFYLYLHLAVLSMLLGGEDAWHGFLELATTPLFLGLDVLLLSGLLFHGLNGLRVALVGSGIAVDRQKALFWSLMIFGAILLLGATLHIVGSG